MIKRKPSRSNGRKHILVLLWASAIASGRDFFLGFVSQARKKPKWSIHLRVVKRSFEPNLLRSIRSGAYHGIVTNEETYKAIPADTIPKNTTVAVFGTYDTNAPRNVIFIQNDNAAIGRFGAKYLLGLGNFRTYCFVPTENHHEWAEIRGHAFAAELASAGRTAHVFDHCYPRHALNAWLTSLPKPIAIMAACDSTALEAIEICKRAHLAVPRQVSIIGVDNDELLCEHISPTLTSILPRHDIAGQLVVKALSMSFQGWKRGKPKRLICDRQTIIERESSAPISPATHLISSAIEYIKSNATKGINVQDVVAYLGVSRSLLDLRFRQYQNQSVGRLILETRLDEIKKHLLSANLPIKKIAHACGFTNIPNLQVIFKRKFGLPMGKWRQQHQISKC